MTVQDSKSTHTEVSEERARSVSKSFVSFRFGESAQHPKRPTDQFNARRVIVIIIHRVGRRPCARVSVARV